MNYYDEEITINGPDTKNLSNIRVSRLPLTGSALSGIGTGIGSARGSGQVASGSRTPRPPPSNVLQRSSTDDDGLLQDIIDHDDDEDDDEDDSDLQKLPIAPLNTASRPQTRPGSTRILNLPNAKALDNDTDPSETESDEAAAQPRTVGLAGIGAAASTTSADMQLSITPDKWEQLSVHHEVKELFPYILKYTPQHIETPYHLQPFIPDYVPAVGDVDAFLKVANPPLLQPQRQQEINTHLSKLGLYFLDEPSGEQSEPSLLNMKLRSVLTGSGVNPRSASAALMPIAKLPKDIDKWITEIEQVHMTQSVHDVQPRKDIEPLLLDWPRAYSDAAGAVQNAYQRCLQEDITLTEYIRELCERFGVEGPLETQTDYLLNVQTLFALYLAANQAWE